MCFLCLFRNLCFKIAKLTLRLLFHTNPSKVRARILEEKRSRDTSQNHGTATALQVFSSSRRHLKEPETEHFCART